MRRSDEIILKYNKPCTDSGVVFSHPIVVACDGSAGDDEGTERESEGEVVKMHVVVLMMGSGEDGFHDGRRKEARAVCTLLLCGLGSCCCCCC